MAPLDALLDEYVNALRVKDYSENTVRNRQMHIRFFLRVVRRARPRRAHRDHPARAGTLSAASVPSPQEKRRAAQLPQQHARLVALRIWFRWMTRQNHILHNPASEIELPRLGHRLPKHVLTASEAEQVMMQPKLADPIGLRDRAILEVFYSTGIRRMELIRLKLYDLDTERGTLLIRQGKGKKDRFVPIGERAVAWVEKYIREARPQLAAEPDDGTLFLANARRGDQPRSSDLDWCARYVVRAKLGKTGACHLFRHTMATLMLEGGADIRFIQQMLGHAELATTEIYTHVSIRMLKQVHSATHPAASLGPDTAPPVPAPPEPESDAEALFATLDAEAEDESG